MAQFNDRYVHVIDSKGRLQLSREIRARFKMKKGDTVHLLPNPGQPRFLEVRSESQWKAFYERLMDQPPGSKKRDVVRFVELMYETATADSQCRFVVPQGLRAFCGFDREVAVINMHSYVEVWNKEAVEQKYSDMLRAYNEVTDLFY